MDGKAQDYQGEYTEAQDGTYDYEDIVPRLQVKVDGIWVRSSIVADGVGKARCIQVRGTNCTRGDDINGFPCVQSELQHTELYDNG